VSFLRKFVKNVKPVVSVAARAVAAYYTAGASEAYYQKLQESKRQAAAAQREQDDYARYFPPSLTDGTATYGELPRGANGFQWGAFATDVIRGVPVVGEAAAGVIEGRYSDDGDTTDDEGDQGDEGYDEGYYDDEEEQ